MSNAWRHATRARTLGGLLAFCALATMVVVIWRWSATENSNSRGGARTDDDGVLLKASDVSPAWVLEHFNLPAEFKSRAENLSNQRNEFDLLLAEYLGCRTAPKSIAELSVRSHPRTIEDFAHGRLRLGVNEPIEFRLPFDWRRTDRGANFLSELNSLKFLMNFIEAHQQTGAPEYLAVAESILRDWIEKNPFERGPRAWAEGTVSKRTLVLANFVTEYARLRHDRTISLTTLLGLIHQHASFLARQRSYVKNGNHGVRQDLALLSTALLYPEFGDAAHWQATALERLRTQQVATGFTSEGVWREHSPTYHYYAMKLMGDVARVVEESDIPQNTEFLRALEAQSQKYLAHVLTPAGRFPPVGDSSESTMALENISDLALLFSHSQGERGVPPTELDGYFPEAGEAIFRDAWIRPDRPADHAFYVHMHAAAHDGFDHRHADDLSFVLHALGRWWILEGGKYTYDRGEFRDYFTSAQAHNGVTFNGETLAANDFADPQKKVWFEATMVSTPLLAAARAHTTRFPPEGVKAARTFVFLRQRQMVVLFDHLQSPTDGVWESSIHLAPDLVPVIDAASVIVSTQSNPPNRLEIVTESAKIGSIQMIKGQQDPLMGWYSPDYGEMVPTPVLILKRAGRDVRVATIIRLGDGNEPSVTALQSRIDRSRDVITWHEGAERCIVEISFSAPLEVSFQADSATNQD